MARILIVLLALVLVAACAPERQGRQERQALLTVVDAYAPEPVTDETAAVYLTVHNGTATADTLTGATSPIAAAAGLHEQMTMGGMTHMMRTGAIAVPPGGALRLEPGGTHLMLERLVRRPGVGDTIDVTLTFSHAGPIRVRVPVIPYAEVSDRAARPRR